MEKHYQIMLHDTEERVFHYMDSQEMNRKDRNYGGFYNADYIVHARPAFEALSHLITVYVNSDSRYYHSESLYERIIAGFDYINSVQHENGLIDYVTCNFYSAPDTAFCIMMLIPDIDYMRGINGRTEKEDEILSRAEEIVNAGAHGLLEGGFHTPNHRWAIASCLTKCGQMFSDERLTETASIYLREGIDCNEDGEFAEKSAGNYNCVNNAAMILLSETLGDDFYDSCAVRNLKLMLCYWEPDGSIFTANSTRFDKDRVVYPGQYYLQYLKLGVKYNEPEFLKMCNRIFDIVSEKNIMSPDCLIWYMLRPDLRRTEAEGSYVSGDFRRYCEWSGIFRGRRGNFTYTVMNGKSDFLYFNDGTVKLGIKLGGSFCEHRAFKGETMEILEDGTIHLHQTMRGWYYLPFEEKQETSDWWKMNQSARKKKMGPDMQIDAYIIEKEDGIDLRLKTEGVEGAPWRVELSWGGITHLANDHMSMAVKGDEVIVMNEGTLEAYNRKDTVLVWPCFGTHRFTEGKEDSEAKTAGTSTVCFTDYTGFDHTIHIRNRRDMNS